MNDEEDIVTYSFDDDSIDSGMYQGANDNVYFCHRGKRYYFVCAICGKELTCKIEGKTITVDLCSPGCFKSKYGSWAKIERVDE